MRRFRCVVLCACVTLLSACSAAPTASSEDVAFCVYIAARESNAAVSQSIVRTMPTPQDGILVGLESLIRDEWTLASEARRAALKADALRRCRELPGIG